MRARLSDALKTAMKAHESRAVSTLRMVLATLKNRDIAVRDKGNNSGIAEPEIQQKLAALGDTVRYETLAQFKDTVRRDRLKWAQVVKDVGATIE